MATIRKSSPRDPQRCQEILAKLDYFLNNAHAMRYAHFRNQGLFVGSGVIEAACKTLIAQRLKHSGMFWSVQGANAILALRCLLHSNRFDDFWDDQAA